MQEASIYVLGTIYFWKVSRHWIYFCLMGYAFQLASLILLIWVPESPRYLVKVGKLEEARKVFQIIASWNGT